MTEDLEKWEERHPAETSGSTDLVLAAINRGLSPELIGRMMDLAERNEANIARKAYHEAMAAFKAAPPDIDKDRTVSFDVGNRTTSYNHASLANVTNKINSALSKHGLSAGWKTEQGDKGITVTCTITHKQGHSESTALTAGADTSGSKNSIQAIGSTISYLERYTILALTGLATREIDDDAKCADKPPDTITEKQAKTISELIREKQTNSKAILEYAKVAAIEDIPAKLYAVIVKRLNLTKPPEREPGSEG